MRPRISPRAAVLILSAAFLGSEAAAQTGVDGFPPPTAKMQRAPAVVSVDILRHPLTSKVRRLLLRAMAKMDAGDHETAISMLSGILSKYPDSAAYVDNLLGVEYVKTDRFPEAVQALEKAVSLLPRDAMTHYNFGLALVCTGDYERATREVERALELDPKNTRMQARLDALMERNSRSGASNAANVARTR
jgi:predicted Zn-dependent protease